MEHFDHSLDVRLQFALRSNLGHIRPTQFKTNKLKIEE